MLYKIDIFTNKYVDTQSSQFKQKKIQKLFEKDIFKVIILDKIVLSEQVLSSI